MLPEEIAYFYWQNSGGEAIDKSLKIAKVYTGQTGVVAFKGGFHGRTHGAIAVTYNIKYREPFGLDSLDWVHFVDYNDASTVEELFVSGKSKIVILELVQGEEAGIRPAHPDFVKKLRQICDRYDGVLICDEVQTGFGRVAEKEGQWFACQNYDIVPDIIVIGKSFGGGYPVTAVVTNEKISQAMVPGYDGSTFGGNPMAMVSAMIATRQMQNLNLTKNVIDRSIQIKEGLYKLREKYSLIGDIRIKGLFIGFDLPSVEHTWKFQQLLARHSIKSSLTTDKTIRFLPPLVISKAEIDFLLNKIDLALDDLEKYDQDN
ncbi:[LysW]-aminoadipate semialdehyde transaminase [subsurface metagenome]